MTEKSEKENSSLFRFYEDGFWDIFLGSVFISGGLFVLSGSVLSYLFALGGLLALIIGRLTITQPRMAAIEQKRPQTGGRNTLLFLLLIAMLLILALWILPASGILSRSLTTGLIFSLAVPLILLYLAFLLKFKRLYGYAIFVALFMLTGQFVSPTAGAWVQILSGLVIVSIGLWQLNKFLKYSPRS